MAKNLKQKIKNTQLAQALNLDKVKTAAAKKKTAAKKTTTKAKNDAKIDEVPDKEEKAQDSLPKKEEAAPVKKKSIKATDVPSSVRDMQKAKEEKIAAEAKAEEEKIAPPVEKNEEPAPVEEPVKAAEVKEAPKEAAPPKEDTKPPKLGRGLNKSETPKIREPRTPPKEEKKPKPKEAAQEKKPTKSFSPSDDKAKKFKDTKTVKRFETKSFDGRDRQGLRDNEEGSWRRRRRFHKKGPKKVEPVIRPSHLTLKLPITVKDFASAMKVKASELIQKLFMQGVVITINDYLEDETTLQLLGSEFECEITIDTTEEERLRITDKTILEEIKETPEEELEARPPIVTFMGHVDHGKTSLIDSLRKSNLASGEAGDITQHIGAFKCHSDSGDITVLDTPGHEAFTEMRMRGATVTDLIILVIAGDEGMMPQTEEAIKHALASKVPILVAINKCDKPSFNQENVYRQLAEKELLPESWGGQTITVNCSATTGEGISTLLEMILLQAEVLELGANPKARARGSVIESQLHKGLGAVATILVQNGTLKKGDALVFDEIYGRVKTMHDEHGKQITKAPPSTPVKITGLSGIPEAGCEFIAVENEKQAREICEERTAGQVRARLKGRKTQVELEGMLERNQELQAKKVLNLIIRADVQGSLEALKNSLLKIPSQKVEINFIAEGVGQISESDVELAAASNATIIGFHTSVERHAEEDISRLKVVVKSHDIIYHLVDAVKELMVKTLDKVAEEHEVAKVLVKAIFKASHLGIIAGCQVLDGTIKRNHLVKLERAGEIIFEGEIESLKRVKEDVKEVAKGLECGILIKNFREIEPDDIIRAFEITYHEQELT